MACQDELNHPITWEEKKYFKNTSSTSYGNPVTALYQVGKDGRPLPQALTEAGLKHFGYLDESNDEAEAKKERIKIKSEDNDGCCWCWPFKCLWKLVTCLFRCIF